MRECSDSPRAGVNLGFTLFRVVETSDYIGAVRRMIRAAGRRTGDADEVELRQLLGLREDLDAAVQEAVDGQRRIGRSWAYIASATGTSRQAAFQRWGRVTGSSGSEAAGA